MKKIALILAVVMLFSAVSVFAEPSVEYIFYGVDDTEGGTGEYAFFVFGKYTNTYTIYKEVTTDIIAEDVGVYYNGKKYSYVEGGNTTNKTGLFGIAFDDKEGLKNKMTSFNVEPYSVSNYGEVKSVTHEYDFANNEMKLPSNNNLASVSIERKQDGRGTAMALMEPAFDPDIPEYTIYGFFGNGNNKLTNVDLHFTSEDPKATIIESPMVTKGGKEQISVSDNKDEDGNYLNYQIVTVRAQNGEEKTYKFNFETTGTDLYYAEKDNVRRPTSYISEKVEDGTYTAGDGVIYTYPKDGKKTSSYLVFTFPITEAMKKASTFSINTSNITGYYFNNLENVVIAARAYDATAVERLGTIGGKYVIKDSSIVPASGSTSCICGIDITNIVKEAIDKGQSTLDVALQILSCESYGGITTPGIKLPHKTYYQGDTSNLRGVYICWK